MSAKQAKTSLMDWLDAQLDRDPKLRQEVDQTLDELRLEQDLIALRKARGLSQGQLAKLVGVSQPAIAKIESGKIKNLQLKTLQGFSSSAPKNHEKAGTDKGQAFTSHEPHSRLRAPQH